MEIKKRNSNFEIINHSNFIKNYNLSLNLNHTKSYINLPKINSISNLHDKKSLSNKKKEKEYYTINNRAKKVTMKLEKKINFRNNSQKKCLNNYSDIKKYLFYSQLKLPNLRKFHKELMKENKEKQKTKSIEVNKKNEDNNIIKNENKEEEEKEVEKKFEKEFTGKQSLSEYLKLRKADLIFNKSYHKKEMNEELKILLKKEIKKAKKKLKIKNKELELNDNIKQKPIWLKNIEKYNCISYQNPLLQVNQPGNVQLLVKDGELMYQLFQDGFEICDNKRYKVHY